VVKNVISWADDVQLAFEYLKRKMGNKSSMHGYALLDSDKQLTKTIVAWCDNNLVNN
jgi:hypothetical protein